MKKRKQQKAPAVFVGAFIPKEIEILLKLYSACIDKSMSYLLRDIIFSFFKENKIDKDFCITFLLRSIDKDWEEEKKKFIRNPEKEITKMAYTHQRLHRLPASLTNEIINKLNAKNEKQ